MTNKSEHVIGELNEQNGICGFAASVYMACKIDPRRRPSRAQGDLPRRMLVEIAYFLQTLENTDRQLFLDIENFTRSFEGPWADFAIKEYIALCNFAVNVNEEQMLSDYDVAMPPKAVAAYLKQAWGIDAMALPVNGGEGGAGNCILGLCVDGAGLYGNLKHWVYRHNGEIYSYGRTYENLGNFITAVETQYKVGWIVC